MNKITYKNILKQFDFLKFQISFSYKSNYLYKSAVGGFLTIINIVFILYFSIDNMINVLKKSNKYSILWNESEDLNTIIDFSNIPFAFKLVDLNGSDIDYDPKLYNFSIDIIKAKNIADENSPAFIDIIKKKIEFENCNKNIYYNELEKYSVKYNFSKFLCIKPNQDIKLYGIYGDISNEFSMMKIYLNKCQNKNNETNCYSKDEINNRLNGAIFYYMYIGYYVNHETYSDDIVTKKLMVHHVKTSSNFLKKYYYYFKNGNYILNNNYLIFGYSKKYTFFQYDGFEFDIEYDDSHSNITSADATNSFSFMTNCKKIEFTKNISDLWDFVGKIGGIINVVVFFTRMINNYITKRLLFLNIYDDLHNTIKKNDLDDNDNKIKCNDLNLCGFKKVFNKNTHNEIKIKSKALGESRDNHDNSEVMNIKKNQNFYNINNIPSNFSSKKNYFDGKSNTFFLQQNKIQSTNLYAHDLCNGLIAGNQTSLRSKTFKGIGPKRQISKNHYILFYCCPLICLKNTTKYSDLYGLEKDICKFLSVENFIKVINIVQNIVKNTYK